VESRARELNGEASGRSRTEPSIRTPAPGAPATSDPAIRRIEEQLRKQLQTDVHVQALGNDRGVVRISFYSADDLERLLDIVVGRGRSDFD
jgi:hypothetical protein